MYLPIGEAICYAMNSFYHKVILPTTSFTKGNECLQLRNANLEQRQDKSLGCRHSSVDSSAPTILPPASGSSPKLLSLIVFVHYL